MDDSYVLGCVLLLLQIITIVLLLLYLFKRKRQRFANRTNSEEPVHSDAEASMILLEDVTNADFVILENDNNSNILLVAADQLPEIELSRLEMYPIISSGSFSRGNFAALHHAQDTKKCVKVYVKPHDKARGRAGFKELLHELSFLTNLNKHPNILAIIGFFNGKNNIGLVFEYLEDGDLLNFMRKSKSIFINQLVKDDNVCTYNVVNPILDSDINSLNTMDLLSFAYQISNGLKFLADCKCIHRDIALRNILVSNEKTIRIADFGLAMCEYYRGYYRETDPDVAFPIYSMAPECIESQTFTEKSDVWSFAVCLFELFSFGERLYENVTDVIQFLNEGNRLAQPEYCHDKIYELMYICWNSDEQIRPDFSNCVQFFKDHFKDNNLNILDQIEKKLCDASKRQKELSEWV